MGFALAREARVRGARVTLVAGPTQVEPPAVAELVRVRSARDMHERCHRARGDDATSSSWPRPSPTTRRPTARPQQDRKGGPLTLALERTSDILAELGARGGAPRAGARRASPRRPAIPPSRGAPEARAPSASISSSPTTSPRRRRIRRRDQPGDVRVGDRGRTPPAHVQRRRRRPSLDRSSGCCCVAGAPGVAMSGSEPLADHLQCLPRPRRDRRFAGRARGASARAIRRRPRPRPVVGTSSVAPVDPSREHARSDVARRHPRPHIGDCTRCALHKQGRRQVVFGVGNPKARSDVRRRGAGRRRGHPRRAVRRPRRAAAHEDHRGDRLHARRRLHRQRHQVPAAGQPQSRAGRGRDVRAVPASTDRDRSVRKVIVALGTFAAQALLKTDTPISRLRGRVHELPRRHQAHPDVPSRVPLRSPDRKRDVWEDMKKVRALLADRD